MGHVDHIYDFPPEGVTQAQLDRALTFTGKCARCEEPLACFEDVYDSLKTVAADCKASGERLDEEYLQEAVNIASCDLDSFIAMNERVRNR